MPKRIRLNTEAFSGSPQADSSGSDLSGLPEELIIPEHFKGVIQVNVQAQRETETETETNTQANATNVSVQALQNQMTNVTVTLSGLQAAVAESLAQQRAMQNQLQLLFMLLLGSAENREERQALIREVVERMRDRPPE